MKFLEKIKRKERPIKKTKVKKVTGKKANQLVSGFLVVLLVASVIGAIRSNVMASNLGSIQKQLKVIDEKTQKTKTDEHIIDENLLNHYVTSFFTEYINVPKEDASRKERLERLEKYVSFEVSELDEKMTSDSFRKLSNLKVIEVEEENDCYFVHVVVKYEFSKNGKNESIKQEFVLPVVEENQLFSVVSVPYHYSSELPQGKTTPYVAIEKTVEIKDEEKEKFEKFLVLFFDKYTTSKKEDLLLLMKNPDLMGGNEKKATVEKTTIKYFDTDEKGIQGVQLSVTFEDAKTKTSWKENFSLWLSKTENSFFVEKMKHYFVESEMNEK